MNSLSVVIPTKDRADALARTLDALEAQQAGDAKLEAIVIDNGSNDETVAQVQRRATGGTLAIRLLERPQGGPAAARNAGAEVAEGDVLLFLGDDTEPSDENLLRAHLDLHAARPEPGYGVLGRITWTPRKSVTPFMHWLENGGPQFHYCQLEAGPVDAASYFYSSHASLKRAIFERVGGFDVRFPTAAVEDTELGVRLADAGLELDYHPELLVLHDHPTTPEQSLRRSVAVGRSAALYNRLRPDRPHPGVQAPRGLAWSAVRAAEPLLGALAKMPLPGGLRERVWLAMTRAGYARGYRLGPVEGSR
ncbi:MAG TPA: glycosyltransferase [Solirubrobacterales bacterium]|jgi:glycosyltransferase involved in cell wall biosynthesis|nr:glycosyltransferase [Solirubrobacterales bacterium]